MAGYVPSFIRGEESEVGLDGFRSEASRQALFFLQFGKLHGGIDPQPNFTFGQNGTEVEAVNANPILTKITG